MKTYVVGTSNEYAQHMFSLRNKKNIDIFDWKKRLIKSYDYDYYYYYYYLRLKYEFDLFVHNIYTNALFVVSILNQNKCGFIGTRKKQNKWRHKQNIEFHIRFIIS